MCRENLGVVGLKFSLEISKCGKIDFGGTVMAIHNQHGFEAEALACSYLENLGYLLLHKNFSCREGEIDLVMEHNEILVFVEVRSLKRITSVHPLEALSRAKLSRIVKAANFYLMKYPTDKNVRFDLVLVLGVASNLKHYQNILEV